jgi:tRNA/rRNA methyltransferase
MKIMAHKDTPIIILVRPQLPENIGSVARAMNNFGLKELRLVSPLFSPQDPKSISLAAGADDILERAKIYDSLEDAISDLHYVYATSATQRHMVKSYASVKEAMVEIVDFQNVGIVFGPERTGLTNDELPKFRSIIHVPVNPEFSSLNLAQSVAITAYEWYQTQTDYKGDLHMGESLPATQQQLQGFLNTLEQCLDDIHFWRIDHKKPIMWQNLQNIFTRMDLTEQEVRTLHGMIKLLADSK